MGVPVTDYRPVIALITFPVMVAFAVAHLPTKLFLFPYPVTHFTSPLDRLPQSVFS